MNITKFDVTDHLDNEEVIAEYLTVALEDADPNVFLAALADVAKARGMAQFANRDFFEAYTLEPLSRIELLTSSLPRTHSAD